MFTKKDIGCYADGGAQQAIDRSVSHREIVTVDYDAEAQSELEAASEDSVHTDDVTEYWGTTDDGDDWRVHMRDEERPTGYYEVDAGDGNELCSGLAPEIARKAAQDHADRLGESVYLYEVGSDAKAEEIEPAEALAGNGRANDGQV